MQTLTRRFEFDAGHRVMDERMKCFNAHGHRYVVELIFSFASIEEIGYAIDFKEIKRVGCQWIDDMMDHAFILNPKDQTLGLTLVDLKNQIYIMSLNGKEYCNPTAENISKEIFMAMDILFRQYKGLKIKEIILYETPNCWVNCTESSYDLDELANFRKRRENEIEKYATEKGIFEYDQRKCNTEG